MFVIGIRKTRLGFRDSFVRATCCTQVPGADGNRAMLVLGFLKALIPCVRFNKLA